MGGEPKIAPGGEIVSGGSAASVWRDFLQISRSDSFFARRHFFVDSKIASGEQQPTHPCFMLAAVVVVVGVHSLASLACLLCFR